MLTIGVILLIIGAVVAIAARGRDDAIRFIGVGCALLGLVLIVIAVLPEDADAAVVFPLLGWKNRRDRRAQQIDQGLAVCLAGQVAVGLAHAARPEGPHGSRIVVEQERERAHAALMAIGLMVANASGRDAQVMGILEQQVEIERGPAVTHLRSVG